MAGRIRLPAWPTTLDCIAWSEDNWIAVACGEEVAIITPRLQQPGPTGLHWDHTLFKANAFTAQEIPLSEPLSFKNLSIGEELSDRHVDALAWSSPRLARYGRCLLGILSSSHALSLWECDGRPTVPGNWKRRVVVNHAIRTFYQGSSPECEVLSEQDRSERMQVKQRARAFCWSPPVYQDWSDDREDSAYLPYVDAGCQWLAVSTEAEDILLVSIQTPHGSNQNTRDWTVEVVYRLSTDSLIPKVLSPEMSNHSSELGFSIAQRYIADFLTWGPWKRNEDSIEVHSQLAFISKGKLFTSVMKADSWKKTPEIKLSNPIESSHHILPSRSDLTGPFCFVPNTESLVCFGVDAVVCVDMTAVSTKPPPECTTHHLDGRWDEISGLAITADRSGRKVQIVSHLSSATTPTATLSIPLAEDEVSTLPRWQETLDECREDYSAQYKLGGQVQERTFGIAVSPLGDYIATVATMLPSDSIAYVIQSEQESLLNINDVEESLSDSSKLFPCLLDTKAIFSSEVVLFSMKNVLRVQNRESSARQLANMILDLIHLPGTHRYFQDDENPLDVIREAAVSRQYLRMKMYLHPAMISGRFEALANIALGNPSAASNFHRPVVTRLVRDVCGLSLPSTNNGDLSNNIMQLYAIVQRRLSSTAEPSPDAEWHEQCTICDEFIEFQSVKWSRCKTGHQFVRCALSFLTIQEPGISKYCTICNTQYLDELKLPSLRWRPESDEAHTLNGSDGVRNNDQYSPNDDDPMVSAEPSDSMARVLFSTFDMCIYCGGKFTP